MTIGDLMMLVWEIAPNLPTGAIDPDTRRKYDAECDELHNALVAGDIVGALTEAADVAYYIGKMRINDAITIADAERLIDLLIADFPKYNHEPIGRADLLRLIRAKYESRIRHGKDDARERTACVRAV